METGLFYNDFRDYDPEVGRYVQRDRAGGWRNHVRLPWYYRSLARDIGVLRQRLRELA
jgi:RHS repeat-associated protein